MSMNFANCIVIMVLYPLMPLPHQLIPCVKNIVPMPIPSWNPTCKVRFLVLYVHCNPTMHCLCFTISYLLARYILSSGFHNLYILGDWYLKSGSKSIAWSKTCLVMGTSSSGLRTSLCFVWKCLVHLVYSGDSSVSILAISAFNASTSTLELLRHRFSISHLNKLRRFSFALRFIILAIQLACTIRTSASLGSLVHLTRFLPY